MKLLRPKVEWGSDSGRKKSCCMFMEVFFFFVHEFVESHWPYLLPSSLIARIASEGNFQKMLNGHFCSENLHS